MCVIQTIRTDLLNRIVIWGMVILFQNVTAVHAETLLPELTTYVQARIVEFDAIPEPRRERLVQLADEIRRLRESKSPVRLTFICTHNSRRSHFGQVWAAVAAEQYGLRDVSTFSGGTEATACNTRTIAALRRAGLMIDVPGTGENPRYSIQFASNAPNVTCFSKVYSDSSNPQNGFIAVMTCSDAETRCPVVMGAASRFAITYDDPKQADDTAEEAARYDERCRQIAREMLFVFSQASR